MRIWIKIILDTNHSEWLRQSLKEKQIVERNHVSLDYSQCKWWMYYILYIRQYRLLIYIHVQIEYFLTIINVSLLYFSRQQTNTLEITLGDDYSYKSNHSLLRATMAYKKNGQKITTPLSYTWIEESIYIRNMRLYYHELHIWWLLFATRTYWDRSTFGSSIQDNILRRVGRNCSHTPKRGLILSNSNHNIWQYLSHIQ